MADDLAFFSRDGDWYVGNDSSRGPWTDDACHAGPVTAAVAGELENVPTSTIPAPDPAARVLGKFPVQEARHGLPFFGNGISSNADFSSASFVNPDLTIVAYRLPESEWLASEAISFWEPTGIGMSQATLFDERGSIGTARQTLIVRPTR